MPLQSISCSDIDKRTRNNKEKTHKNLNLRETNFTWRTVFMIAQNCGTQHKTKSSFLFSRQW